MYQTEDDFISIIEQLYIEGMDAEAEAMSIILKKYINKKEQNEEQGLN
jgi:hypothetical protein